MPCDVLGSVSVTRNCLLAVPVLSSPLHPGQEGEVHSVADSSAVFWLLSCRLLLNEIKTWCCMVSFFRLDFILQPPYLLMRLIPFVVAEGLLKSTRQAGG